MGKHILCPGNLDILYDPGINSWFIPNAQRANSCLSYSGRVLPGQIYSWLTPSVTSVGAKFSPLALMGACLI